MQTFISTLCTCLLLALFFSLAAQPTPKTVPKVEKWPEQIALPPVPGEEPPTSTCFMDTGNGKGEELKADFSRKPEAVRNNDKGQIADEHSIFPVNKCPDAPPPPPPPPPPPETDIHDSFRTLEEMPRFSGCEGLPTLAEKKQCAEEKLFKFIHDNVNYPEAARKRGIQGTVVIQFIVEKDGSMTGARIVRDIGGQCGQEALRVINLMSPQGLIWIPAKQIGRPVRAQMNIPVRYKLDDSVQFCTSPVTEVCSISEKPDTEAPTGAAWEPPPPPPQCPPSPYHLKPGEEEIFRIVEEMPRFPGCEELPTAQERRQCSDKEMLDFLYRNITYPTLARESCVQGTVVIQFVVEKDGSVTNAKVVRDIGARCGEAALDVINLMNEQGLKWIPGRQRGRAVRVQFNLPVKFRIECPETQPAAAPGEPASDPNAREEKTEQADEALTPTEAIPSGTPLRPEGFRLFPNPAADWLNVRFRAVPGPVSLSIVNPAGQVLWKQEHHHPGGILEEQADLAQWPPGAYFLRIQQKGAFQTHRFVKWQ